MTWPSLPGGCFGGTAEVIGRSRAALEMVAQLRPTGTSQEAVLSELRRVLASGRVRAGTVVPVDQIAAAFGVSRTPVREALKSLIGEGLIRHSHRGGYLVHAPTRDEFVELYTIRSALEGAALTIAVPRAGEAERRLPQEILERQRAALAAGDVSGWDAEGRSFHEALAAPCGMPRLCLLLRDAGNSSAAARPMLRLRPARVRSLHADHEALAEAFAEGATERVVSLAGQHLHRVRSWVLASFDAPS